MAVTLPTLPALEASIRRDLDGVESLLRTSVASSYPLLDDAARFLIEAGGKRFRPMLLLLSGRFGNETDPRLVACAAAIELTHLATLYHDDVMDETDLRRGVETAHRRYGNARAILVGDYLFARASGISADLGVYVSRRLADTIAELVEGQVVETEFSAGENSRLASVDEHLDVLRMKTATLIASSCHLGAYLAGADTDVVDALTVVGESMGMAFQLSDDLLDLVGDAKATGKEPGTDLRDAVFTLAPLLTLQGATDGADVFRAQLDGGNIPAAISVLEENGSIERAREHVRRYRDRALAALETVPANDAREGLAWMASHLDERTV